jgi:hypothetical protein
VRQLIELTPHDAGKLARLNEARAIIAAASEAARPSTRPPPGAGTAPPARASGRVLGAALSADPVAAAAAAAAGVVGGDAEMNLMGAFGADREEAPPDEERGAPNGAGVDDAAGAAQQGGAELGRQMRWPDKEVGGVSTDE